MLLEIAISCAPTGCRAEGSGFAEAGYGVSNIDATVIAEAPMLAPHISQMRELLADALTVDLSNVSIKATTTDRLGSIGRGEGIAAVAVALIDST